MQHHSLENTGVSLVNVAVAAFITSSVCSIAEFQVNCRNRGDIHSRLMVADFWNRDTLPRVANHIIQRFVHCVITRVVESELCYLDRNRALAGDGFSQLESIGNHTLSVSVHLTEEGREGGREREAAALAVPSNTVCLPFALC